MPGTVGAARPPQRDPAAAQRLNEQGLQLLQDDQLEEARFVFERALAADPYCGPAHCNLGVALLRLGHPYESAWELQYACRLLPQMAAPRANLGILYELAGRWGTAEEQLTEALRLAPDDLEIIGHLARVHVRAGKCTADTLAWLQTIASQDDDPAWRGWARAQLTRTSNEPLKRGD
jgi:Flp pilus assembly protein TadD